MLLHSSGQCSRVLYSCFCSFFNKFPGRLLMQLSLSGSSRIPHRVHGSSLWGWGWGNCSPHLNEKLQRFQNRAARIIAAVNYETNSAHVLESLGWETLEERHKRNKSILIYRILNNRTAPNLKELFTRIDELLVNYVLRSRCILTKLFRTRKETFLKIALGILVQNSGTIILYKLKLLHQKMYLIKLNVH